MSDGTPQMADAPAPGLTEPSRPGGHGGFLSEVIIELGFAGEEAVEQALEHARKEGRTFAEAVLDTATLDESQLARAVAEHHGLPHADLDEFDVDAAAVRLISRAAAQRYRGVPICLDSDGSLLVALADPVDALAVSDIAVMTKSDIRPVVATGSAIEALIATIPAQAAGRNGHLPDPVEQAAPPLVEEPPAAEKASPLVEEPPAAEKASPPLDPLPATVPTPEPSPPTEQPPAPEPAAQPASAAPSPPDQARARSEGSSPRLQEKIASLIEGALDGLAEFEVAELEAELESARAEIPELEAELESARAEIAELAAQLEAAQCEQVEHVEREQALESARAEIAELAAQLEAAQCEQVEHVEREQALQAQLSAAQQGRGELKQALSNVLLAASDAQAAAEGVNGLQDETGETPPPVNSARR